MSSLGRSHVREGRPHLDWGVGHYERTAQVLLPAAQMLVQTAAPRAGEHVLDLGAGTGSAALLAAAAGADVTAVDPSARLLSVAAETARQQGLALRCAVGEASHLPAADDDFDCVVSSFGVVFAPDPHEAAAELARVLRPGGRIAFTAWLPGGALGALAAAVQGLVQSAIGAPPPPERFPWHDEAAVAALFSGHGISTEVAGIHELVFAAATPLAYLEAEIRSHPVAVSAFDVLGSVGRAEEARRRLLRVLEEHNEEPRSFRATSRYVVFLTRPA